MKPLTPSQTNALDYIARSAFYPDIVREEDGWHARWRIWGAEHTDEMTADWLDEYVRAACKTPLSASAEDYSYTTLHDAWLQALRSRTGLVKWPDAECRAFQAALARWHEKGVDDAPERAAIVFSLDAAANALSCSIPHGRRALRALGRAVAVFGPLRGLVRADAARLVVTLSREEMEDFLSRGARALVAAGYGVAGADIAAAITATAEIMAPAKQTQESAPLAVKLVVRVAGQPVTANEIRFLLEQGSSLVFFRGHWIEVDRSILKEGLRALQKSGQCRLSRNEALAFACGIGRIGRFEIAAAASHGWLRGLVNALRQSSKTYDVDLKAEGFVGTLRDYQRRGVAWLSFLTDHGFGALLADDMGLGKTVQVIAWLLARRSRPALIVAPLTLLANWRHELARFAPLLKVYVHQGAGRFVASGFRQAVRESDVVLTSYNLLVREHALFGEVAWGSLVLDEAQAIKNPNTAVARAVRALTPPRRIALTGTPIENSVEDIWSIEAFLNPGFLGERKAFLDRFAKPIAANPQAAAGARLRHALEPFVLRRLKTDDGVAAELGAKREVREYCALSSRGHADYEAALEDYRLSSRKRGDVFALLTRLKLICDGEGKFERLVTLLETIFANGESALVFTQYAKVGRELKARLEKQFARPVPFLHGELSARQREREIADFNAAAIPTAFILSLKAGGFGLNLTKATHVIHYDRWWNPAVECQATDRAHRIGQLRNVLVHLMVTAGTVEEHVDEILANKAAVSGRLVASGEAFLAQLPPALLEKAVALDE